MAYSIFHVTGAALLCLASTASFASSSGNSRPAGSPLASSVVKPKPAASTAPSTQVERFGALPIPVIDPLRLNLDSDPVLALGSSGADPTFRQAIAAAVERNPALDEAVAQVDEARGTRNEAEARMLPTIDLSLSHYEVVARAFSNDTQNLIERSRPHRRSDAIASAQQTVFDFGGNFSRLRAASQRLRAAEHSTVDTQTQVALRGVATWYNVFGYRALTALSKQFLASQRDLQVELGRRIQQGVSAPADVVQLDSYIAATNGEIADYRRRLNTAEAQFVELVGRSPPLDLKRAPPPAVQYRSAQEAQAAIEQAPTVLAAKALASAARLEARAYRADTLPRITAGADIGRYGAFENKRDYDARITSTLSWRLFGGAKQRAEQAAARERGAQARADRVLEDARRDAAIAFTDLEGLQASERALREGYIAARRSRDIIAQRFILSRGTLFDLIASENSYYAAAARYILNLTELDAARYALLARTGTLIDALGLPRQVFRR